MTHPHLTDAQLAEWAEVVTRVNLPPLEVEDEDEGALAAGGATIATVYMADDFTCVDDAEEAKVQAECIATRDLIVAAVNGFPLVLAELRRVRAAVKTIEKTGSALALLLHPEALNVDVPRADIVATLQEINRTARDACRSEVPAHA